MNFFKRQRNPYRSLEQKLGYAFRRRKHLTIALSHPSYRHETESINDDNQRLEYLGDAALSLVVSDFLYQNYPEAHEGILTSLRSLYTSGDTLAQVGHYIKLGEHLLLGKGEKMSGGHARDSNILDAMEAVIGAAWLDGGLKAVTRIFKHTILQIIKVDPNDFWSNNPKGQLQALTQRCWKISPTYKLTKRVGPPHAQQFTVQVCAGKYAEALGEGHNKREAERKAAMSLLKKIKTHNA